MITIHLFAFVENGITVAHCGRRGSGLTATKHLPNVTCADCRRRDHANPRVRRPAPAAPEPVED